jgi:toxin YoeB
VKLAFETEAWKHFLHWPEADKAVFRKLTALIKECQRHPFEGTGKPEPLKGELSGYWSRRITHEHRLVYRVKDGALEILACRYHY